MGYITCHFEAHIVYFASIVCAKVADGTAIVPVDWIGEALHASATAALVSITLSRDAIVSEDAAEARLGVTVAVIVVGI